MRERGNTADSPDTAQPRPRQRTQPTARDTMGRQSRKQFQPHMAPQDGGESPVVSTPQEDFDAPLDTLITGIGATLDTGALYELSAISTVEVASVTGTHGTRAESQRKLGTTVAARLATYGISLPLGVITARILGPHDKGTYTLLLLCSTLFVYCSLGLSTAGIYYVRHKLLRLDEVVGNLLSVGLALSAFASLVYATVALVFPTSWFRDIPLSLRVSVIVLGSVALLTAYFSDMMLAAGDMRGYNLANIIQDVTQAGGLVLFLMVSDQRLPAAMLAYAISMLIALGVVLVRIGRVTQIRLRWQWSVQRRLFSYGARSHVTSLLNLGNMRLDSFLTSLFVGVTAVGYYSVATSLVEIIWQLPLTVSAILFPLAAGQRTAEASGRLVAVIARRTLLLVVVSCIALLIISHTLLPALFGNAYLPALVPLWLLIPGMIGLTLYKTLYSYLLARNHPSSGIISTGLALVATISLDFLLIPRIGIAGAALASSVAYTINGVVILIAFLGHSGVSPALVLIPRFSDLTAIVRGAVHFVGRRRSKATKRSTNMRFGVRRRATHAEAWYTQPTFIALSVGVVAGIWAAFIAFGIDLTLFVLFVIGACMILSLANRLWLCTALLIADLTLTDYRLPFASGVSLRTLLFALLAFAVALAVLQRQLIIPQTMRPMLLAFVLLIVVSTLSDVVNGASVGTFLQRCLMGMLIMVALVGLARHIHDIALVFAPALLLMLLSALSGVAQVYLRTATVAAPKAVLLQYQGRAFGLTQNPINLGNDLVVACAMLGGLLLHQRWPRGWAFVGWVGVATLLLGAYVSGSRSALVAIAVAGAVLFLSLYSRLPRPLFFLIIAVGLGMAVLAIPYLYSGAGISTRSSKELLDSGAQHLMLWVAAALIIRDYPLLGVGYDRFQSVVLAYRAQITQMFGGPSHADVALGTLPVHNDILSMWISFGIVGFLAFLAMHLLAVRSVWRIAHATRLPALKAWAIGCVAGLAAYVVHESFHNAFGDSLILWFLLGAILTAEHLVSEMKRRQEMNQMPRPLFAQVTPAAKMAEPSHAR